MLRSFARLRLFMPFLITHFSKFCSKKTVIFSSKRFLLCYSFNSSYDYPPPYPKVNTSFAELLHGMNS